MTIRRSADRGLTSLSKFEIGPFADVFRGDTVGLVGYMAERVRPSIARKAPGRLTTWRAGVRC